MSQVHLRNMRKKFVVAACGKPRYLYPDIMLSDVLDDVTCTGCKSGKIYKQRVARRDAMQAKITNLLVK